MGGAWGAQVGGSNIPPLLDPLEAMILDPWDPLVLWNDDDDDDGDDDGDGDDHIKKPKCQPTLCR